MEKNATSFGVKKLAEQIEDSSEESDESFKDIDKVADPTAEAETLLDGKSRSEQEEGNKILRVVKEQAFNLSYTKDNLVTKIEFETNQLNVIEKEKLREMQQDQQLKYKDEAARRFNSAKNRSIMI